MFPEPIMKKKATQLQATITVRNAAGNWQHNNLEHLKKSRLLQVKSIVNYKSPISVHPIPFESQFFLF